MKKSNSVFSVLLLLITTVLCIALAPSTAFGSLEEGLDHLLGACHAKRLFNGSVLVANREGVIYSKSFGNAGAESAEKIGPDHAFRLASVGKAFTAMAIMILEEEGKLSWEDEVARHLPEFPYRDVTVRQLLNHTSGLPDYVELMDAHWDKDRMDSPDRKFATSTDALAMFITHHPPVYFEPGKRFSYSNTGYIVLALVVERVSGKSFDEFLKERIFEPLQMTRTLLYSPIKDQPIEHRVFGYGVAPDGMRTLSTDHHYLNGMYGDGEIYSTMSDMFKWDRALYTEKLVSQGTLDTAFSPALLNKGDTSDYGFGWGISRDPDGHKIVSHRGGWVGFSTEIVREIYSGDLTVILSTGSQARFREIREAVANIVHAREYQIPELPVTWIVGGVLRNEGFDAAVEQYRELRSNSPDADDYSEYSLFELGNYLIKDHELDNAIRIFMLDVESFPDSSQTHNSLGKAYLSAGELDRASDCFRKSLALDPREWNEAHYWLEEVKK